jgi:hypothetical protein
MAGADEQRDDPGDAEALARHASALADGIEERLPGWVHGVVVERWEQWRGEPPPPEVAGAAREAAAEAVAVVVPELRRLLATDVDEQWTNPLALVRRAVAHPTRVLAESGVPEVQRDEHAERLFPDDRYDLTPGGFADLHPSLHEPGLVWGAAKAHVILARRRAEGRR